MKITEEDLQTAADRIGEKDITKTTVVEELFKEINDYKEKVAQVLRFAGPDNTAPNWFALAKVGAALVDLRVVEHDLIAHRKHYWSCIVDFSTDPKTYHYLVPTKDFMSAI